MSRRTEQVSAELQTQVSKFLVENIEFDDGVLCTVTHVETTPDLKHSVVYVSIFPEDKRGSSFKILRKSTSSLNKQLFINLPTKIVPKVRFVLDDSETKATKIDALLDQIADELPPLDNSY